MVVAGGKKAILMYAGKDATAEFEMLVSSAGAIGEQLTDMTDARTTKTAQAGHHRQVWQGHEGWTS